jgi:hypothetical protein
MRCILAGLNRLLACIAADLQYKMSVQTGRKEQRRGNIGFNEKLPDPVDQP